MAVKDRFFNELVRIAKDLELAENRLQAAEEKIQNAKPEWVPEVRTLSILEAQTRRARVEFWRYFHGFQWMVEDLRDDEKDILRQTRWAQVEFRKYGVTID